MTTSGYPRIAKDWKRGTPLAAAETVYEGQAEDVSVGAFRDHTKGFERDFVYRGVTFYSNEMFLRRDGKLLKIEKPDSANASVHRDLLLLELRDDWTVGGKTYPAGALLAADFEGFLKGERRFDVLFEPTDRKSLAGFSPTLNHVLLNELDNVRNRVYVLTRKDGTWTREPLPGMPEFGTVSASGVDDEESDDYFLTVTDYLTPTSLSLGTVGKGAPEKLKQLPAYFDAKGLAVSQHEIAVEGRDADPVLPGGPEGPRPRRQEPDPPLRLRRLRDARWCPATAAAWARPGSRRAASTWSRTSAAAASSARSGTRRRSRRTGTRPTRTSSRWPRTSSAARSRARLTSASRAAATAASSWATCSPCGPTSSARSSARCRCSTCGATTCSSPARAGWGSTATRTTRRSGRSSRASRRTTT